MSMRQNSCSYNSLFGLLRSYNVLHPLTWFRVQQAFQGVIDDDDDDGNNNDDNDGDDSGCGDDKWEAYD